jgi:enoyl-CoA hydratase
VPGWSGTQRLVRRFGAGVVRRLALTGEIVTAERALALGLADEVVGTGEALGRARAVAAAIAARGPAATAVAKQLINAAEGEGDEAATLEGLAGAFAAFTEDGAEGVASFREKRPPAYRNR